MSGRYGGASSLIGSGLSLAAAETPDAAPYFRGRVEPGDVIAAGLLVVARAARTRFVLSAAERAVLLDPVVTVDGSGLHVESFSGDGGIYARLDVPAESIDADRWVPGTVNVDFNEPMRAALAMVWHSDPLVIEVGRDSVAVATRDASVVEQRVPLSDRWVRGFAEAQVAAAGLSRVGQLTGNAARRAVAALPRGAGGLEDYWARPTASGLRLLRVAGGGAVWLSAPDRVRLLEPLRRHLRALWVFGEMDRRGPSVWHVNGHRFLPVGGHLSPHWWPWFLPAGGHRTSPLRGLVAIVSPQQGRGPGVRSGESPPFRRWLGRAGSCPGRR